MSIELYAIRIASEVLSERESLEKAYRNYPDVGLYWCMVDLEKSSNYRITRGLEKGYVRGESFFSLINAAIRPYAGIKVIKEIGDAALLCCTDLRPLLESGILMLQASQQLASIAGDETFPFAIRIGVDFGIAKQLIRRNEDYLGEPIDRLARIMSVRSNSSRFLFGESVYSINKKIIDEYKEICTVSIPIQLSLPTGKQLDEQVIYRELHLAERVSQFSGFFTEWKKGSAQRA